MGISELQSQFNAYGSGQLPASELRRFIRVAVSSEPRLSPAFVALTDAYLRANLIDASLHSVISADIAELSAPNSDLTMIRPPGWSPAHRAANSTDVNLPANGRTSPMEPMAPMVPVAKTGARASSRHSTVVESNEDRSWRAPAGDARQPSAVLPALNEVAAANASPANTGSTSGSNWDVEASLNVAAAPLYPGAVIRDRFVLVEELGRGGMGVVYKAYDRSRGDVKDRYVAIKVLNEEFKRHPLAVRSLQREARKAQRLAHPNVVGVHDFDRDGGNVYMVMEFLSGRSLEQVLSEDGRGGIPLAPALDIIKCLGAALSYAHQQDIIHCDFKPSNAFMTRDGKVKVLDFGIARAAPSLLEKGDATLFDAGQLGAISPAYASAEMLQRENPDIRDDVYALACVIYELLTGAHPFQRIDAIKAHQTGLQPRRIRKLTRAQWRALQQGLEFRRAARSPTVDALVKPLVTPRSRAIVWVGAAAACLATIAIAAGIVWKLPELRRTAGELYAVIHKQSAQLIPSGPGAVDAAAQSAPDGSSGPTVPSALPESAPPATPVATATTTDEPAPALISESVALERDRAVKVAAAAVEQKRAGAEILKEQFETQAAAGDVTGASAGAAALARALPGSLYVTRDVPQMLAGSYAHRARTQFAAGKVNESLQTLAEGRRKFGRSADLKGLEARYVGAADVYDRLSSAVVLNATETTRQIEELKLTEGTEFESAAQMLAQTLADRIADQRAAGRETVADKLLEAGKQVFPDYHSILTRGTAGVLSNAPLEVDQN